MRNGMTVVRRRVLPHMLASIGGDDPCLLAGRLGVSKYRICPSRKTSRAKELIPIRHIVDAAEYLNCQIRTTCFRRTLAGKADTPKTERKHHENYFALFAIRRCTIQPFIMLEKQPRRSLQHSGNSPTEVR